MNQAKRILIVDDEVGIRELLHDILQDEGYHITLAENANQARTIRLQQPPDLVLLDIWMPEYDGISLLKEWVEQQLLTMPVIVMSGHATIDTAVEATRMGAFDFLEKPITLQKLITTVRDALKSRMAHTTSQTPIINSLGKSTTMVDFTDKLLRIKSTSNILLLMGVGGCRFEWYAKFLHKPNTPWHTLSDTNILKEPLQVLESARDGIVYIPEITALDQVAQRGLIRIIDKLQPYNVHIICGTHLTAFSDHLEPALLTVLLRASLRIPRITEHSEDIPDITNTMAKLIFSESLMPYRDFDTSALNALRNAPWLGDMDELFITIQILIETNLSAPRITRSDVQRVLSKLPTSTTSISTNINQSLREARNDFERAYFNHHLQNTTGNMSKLSEITGLERTHLYRKLKQLGIKTDKYKDT